MNKIKLGLIVCICAIAVISGCKKEDSKPIVSVTPFPLYIIGHPGNLVTFGISITSEESLKKVTITAQPDGAVPFVLLDTAITTKGANFNFYYILPAAYVGKSIVLDFKAEDQNGVTGGAGKRVYIEAAVSNETTLTETAGHRMYSNLSLNPDAYDLELNAAAFSTVDSVYRDIQDNSETSSVLSKLWTSPAGGKFVRFNSFDYANATDSTAANAYVSGVKLTSINSISLADIIITKLGSVTGNKYVVMRVTDIVDVAGKDNDYYEFSIKK